MSNIGWRGLVEQAASYPHEHDTDPRRYTRRHRRFIAAETRAQANDAVAQRAEFAALVDGYTSDLAD